jgi:hypothetical protein
MKSNLPYVGLEEGFMYTYRTYMYIYSIRRHVEYSLTWRKGHAEYSFHFENRFYKVVFISRKQGMESIVSLGISLSNNFIIHFT